MSILLWITIITVLASITTLSAMLMVAYLITTHWQTAYLVLKITMYNTFFPQKRLHNYQISRNQAIFNQGQQLINTKPNLLMQKHNFKNLKTANQYQKHIQKLINSNNYKINTNQAQTEIAQLGLNQIFTAYNLYLKTLCNLTPTEIKDLNKGNHSIIFNQINN